MPLPYPVTPADTARLPSAAPAPAGSPVFDALKNTATSTFSDPTLLKALLAAALGSGAIGGVLSAKAPKREGETRAQRWKRILANSAGSAAAGAGALGAGALGYNMFKKSPDAQGIASAGSDLFHSAVGRAGSALGLGALGNAAAGKYEQKKTLSRVTNTPGLDAGGQKLPAGVNPKKYSTPPISDAEIKAVFDTPQGKPSLSGARDQRALITRLKTLTPGLTDEGAHDIIRTLGHTPPGERAIPSMLKRHFGAFGSGASRSMFTGKPTNLRALGGLTGTAIGAVAPEIGDIAMKLLGKTTASDGAAPANPGLLTRPIRLID